MNFTALHRIVLGLSSVDLNHQLHLDDSDLETPDIFQRTPLHWAAQRGDLTKVEILLKWGAKSNVRDGWGSTPLHRAAAHGTVACVLALLGDGADVNARDSNGSTALHDLIVRWDPPKGMVDALVRYGADVNTNHLGHSPKYSTLSFSKYRNGHRQNVAALFERGANFYDHYDAAFDALVAGPRAEAVDADGGNNEDVDSEGSDHESSQYESYDDEDLYGETPENEQTGVSSCQSGTAEVGHNINSVAAPERSYASVGTEAT